MAAFSGKVKMRSMSDEKFSSPPPSLPMPRIEVGIAGHPPGCRARRSVEPVAGTADEASASLVKWMKLSSTA